MSETLEEMIERHEGKRRTVYDDATGQPIKPGYTLIGHPTIGVGVNLEEPLSEAAIQLMKQDKINNSRNDCLHAYPWFAELDEKRQWVMIDLCFNMGLPRLMGFKKFLLAMSLGEYEIAANELLDSLLAKRKQRRALALAQMIRG